MCFGDRQLLGDVAPALSAPTFTVEPTRDAAVHNVEPRDRAIGERATLIELGAVVKGEHVSLEGTGYAGTDETTTIIGNLIYGKQIAAAGLADGAALLIARQPDGNRVDDIAEVWALPFPDKDDATTDLSVAEFVRIV